MNVKHAAAGIALLFSALGAAHAATYSYTGNTTAGPTFNRPVTTTDLSVVGTAVHYDAFTFSVNVSGVYSFVSNAETYDNYTVLYDGAFNPAAPLINVAEINDDIGGTVGTSGFLTYLAAGSPYTYVNTGFENADAGKFSASITGDGNIAPVPEPESYAMLAAGLGLLGVVRRRQARGRA